MPGFPDKFTPFYKSPPGSKVSTIASRMLGSLIQPLRVYSSEHLDREVRWDIHNDIPSGWASQKAEPGPLRDIGHRFYDMIRRSSDTAKHGGEVWGKRTEWTEAKNPALDTHTTGNGALPEQREVSRQG
jgi:hydrogenase small subunit